MKRVLRDHGDILHKAGGLGLFPVRGANERDLSFAHHGALEGRTPIGWPAFFTHLGSDRVVVLDEENVTAEVVTEADAIKELGDAARAPSFVTKVKHALGRNDSAATGN